jgi:hypothetical protein
MKQIFGQEALQVLPCQKGFIFVVKQENREEKAVITYKMLDFEEMKMTAVTRNVYLLTKFGKHFERFEDNPDDFLQIRTLLFPDQRLLTVTPQGEATLYAADGSVKWQGELTYQGCAPDSVVADENYVFVSYPDAGAVLRYSLPTMRQDMRIGGGAAPLPKPEGLYYQHGQLLICSPTTNEILQLNPKTLETEPYHTLEEPVHRYAKFLSNELVMLDSGIYKL